MGRNHSTSPPPSQVGLWFRLPTLYVRDHFWENLACPETTGILLNFSMALLISLLMNTAVHMLLEKPVDFLMKNVGEFLTEPLMIYNKEYVQIIVDLICSLLILDYISFFLKEFMQ